MDVNKHERPSNITLNVHLHPCPFVSGTPLFHRYIIYIYTIRELKLAFAIQINGISYKNSFVWRRFCKFYSCIEFIFKKYTAVFCSNRWHC
jgi:hypothetical protein